MQILRDLFNYRGFIFANVKREFELKYQESVLGAAWTIINPLAMIFVYTVVFSQIMRTRLPGVNDSIAYSIFLCSGLFTWEFFTEIIRRGQTVFLDNANLIKKINFPRICLPVILVANACLNFGIIFILFIIFLIVSDRFPGWCFVGIFPILIIQILLSTGLAVILGVMNVFFRDVAQFFNIVLQFWFWFTPIVYPLTVLPEPMRIVAMTWNPMVPVITSYQDIFTNGQWPHWQTLFPVALLGAVFCVFGLHFFRRRSGEMVDEL